MAPATACWAASDMEGLVRRLATLVRSGPDEPMVRQGRIEGQRKSLFPRPHRLQLARSICVLNRMAVVEIVIDELDEELTTRSATTSGKTHRQRCRKSCGQTPEDTTFSTSWWWYPRRKARVLEPR